MNVQTRLVSADSWIDHDGGECPVAWSTKVFVRFEDGAEPAQAYAAGWWEQFWRPVLDRAGRPRNRIVAYRYATGPLAPAVNLPALLDSVAARRRAA